MVSILLIFASVAPLTPMDSRGHCKPGETIVIWDAEIGQSGCRKTVPDLPPKGTEKLALKYGPVFEDLGRAEYIGSCRLRSTAWVARFRDATYAKANNDPLFSKLSGDDRMAFSHWAMMRQPKASQSLFMRGVDHCERAENVTIAARLDRVLYRMTAGYK
jgi:hypothetical protein